MKHTLETLLELAKTDEGRMQIRVMVAEILWPQFPVIHQKYELRLDYGSHESGPCPHYTRSLDAMADAEEHILRTDADAYLHHLKSIRGEHWGFATATERAIAFILTKQ